MNETLNFTDASMQTRLHLNESMADHVSWRAGGRARRAYVPRDLADLSLFLRALPADEPICFVGLGSNLLVRDGGYYGTVILMHDKRGEMSLQGELVYAQAGVASPKLARFAAMHGFAGAEFLAGIPGTVGGALAMNAGCYGHETWQHVARVQVIRRDGAIVERTPRDYEIAYRHVRAREAVVGEDEWFSAAWFAFDRGESQASRERIKYLLAQRVATQPLNLHNAGSVFRNPPGDHAARLIEACGLKGYAIGGARISEKHANFIVNPGGKACAADIENLIAHAREVVQREHGITLQAEVRIIGEAAQQSVSGQ